MAAGPCSAGLRSASLPAPRGNTSSKRSTVHWCRRIGPSAPALSDRRQPRHRRSRSRHRPAAGRDWAPGRLDDWQGGGGNSGDENEDEEDELDLFPDEATGDPEFVIENVLATGLIGLSALALGLILFKLLIVAYALISAAVRYTVIGVLLAVALLVFQPGRWWF